MTRTRRRVGLGVVVIAITAAGSWGASPGSAQPLDRVMRSKLEHARRVLSAIVTEDFEAVEREGWRSPG